MRTITKIACRTIGALGMGVALYDATRVAKHFSKSTAQIQEANYLEDVYFNSRTLDDISYSSNTIQNKTQDLLINSSSIPSIWGSIKGGVKGALHSLGHNLPAIVLASFALLSKGAMAKVGAIGLGLGVCYKVLRDGLGLGKQNPMR